MEEGAVGFGVTDVGIERGDSPSVFVEVMRKIYVVPLVKEVIVLVLKLAGDTVTKDSAPLPTE